MAVLMGSAFLTSGPLAAQDYEPGRGVARISLLNGDVAVRRADSGDYVAAAVNAPLMAQDSVSTGPRSRAEVQFDYANRLRLASNSEVRLTGLDVDRIQMEMARGEATFSVLRDGRSQVEISTPSVSVKPMRRGNYRIYVGEDGETQVMVRAGEAEIYTPQGVERLPAGRTLRARGSGNDVEFQIVEMDRLDEWDNWNEQRDRTLERSDSNRYVSRDIYGAEDLDTYGRWVQDPTYGNVWAPRVEAGWAPYREGRWVWEDYYGWTWVSNDPWGWAPYHYGSWFSGSNGWCWYPGRPYEHQFWRPALVAFFGFGGGYGGGLDIGIGFGFGNVGWVPLAPFEQYRPWYGRGYYGGGYNNTVINNVNIVNNTNITNIYRNATVANGVTGVNYQDFANGRFNNRIAVGGQQIRQANLVTGVVPIAPTNNALRYSDRQTTLIARGNGGQFSQPNQFFTHTPAPAVNRIPFAEQQRNLQQTSRQIIANQNTRVPPTVMGPASNSASRGLPNGGVASQSGIWRQANPVRGGTMNTPGQVAPNQSGAGYRGVATNPNAQLPAIAQQPNQSGWSRFGGPGRTPDRVPASPASRQPGTQPQYQAPQYQPQSQPQYRPQYQTPAQQPSVNSRPSQPVARDNSAWRRFGSPTQNQPQIQTAQPQAQPRTQYQPAAPRDNGSSGWSRFGAPQNHSLPEPHNRYQQAAPLPSQRSQPINGQRFGAQSGVGYSRPLEIAPPIVRQRDQSQYSRPSGYSAPPSRPSYTPPAPSYSRPSYSEPRYSAPSRPSYSAPAPGYSRPSYSQPSYSQPHYSAPPSRPSYSAPAAPAGNNGHSQNRDHGR